MKLKAKAFNLLGVEVISGFRYGVRYSNVMWAPQPLFMPADQEQDPLLELEKKRHDAAISALTFFVSKYEPASNDSADTFYTTPEISKAIADLTGYSLDSADVYELMTQMKYSYEAMNGLEFNWLLKKA